MMLPLVVVGMPTATLSILGPSCFATYNNYHLRVWDPDGARPILNSRQQSKLWEALLNIHLGDIKSKIGQSWSPKMDRNDVFHDLTSIADGNSLLRKILRDWQPVESEFCLKKYSAALDYIRAIVAQEGVTENTQKLSAARFCCQNHQVIASTRETQKATTKEFLRRPWPSNWQTF